MEKQPKTKKGGARAGAGRGKDPEEKQRKYFHLRLLKKHAAMFSSTTEMREYLDKCLAQREAQLSENLH